MTTAVCHNATWSEFLGTKYSWFACVMQDANWNGRTSFIKKNFFPFIGQSLVHSTICFGFHNCNLFKIWDSDLLVQIVFDPAFELGRSNIWDIILFIWFIQKLACMQKYISPIGSMIKFWVTTFWFLQNIKHHNHATFMNQKVVAQNFIMEPTGDKYFRIPAKKVIPWTARASSRSKISF